LLTGLSPLFPTNQSLIFATSAIAIPLAQADDEALWKANQRALSASADTAASSNTNEQYEATNPDGTSSSNKEEATLVEVRQRGMQLEMDGQLTAAMDLYRTFKLVDQLTRLQSTIDAIHRTI
jgi:hypothetical protein